MTIEQSIRTLASALMLTGSLWAISACETKPVNPEPTTPDTVQPATGEPTEAGQPAGMPVTKTIGPAGGVIMLPDNHLTLTIPAGAVTKETTITVQPIENKAFGGAGQAYQITPNELPLQKAATLSWQYTPEDLDGSAPEALGLAYQDKNGVWQGRTDVKLDKAQQTASASVSHLAHWSFYEQFQIKVDRKVIAPTEQANLVVYYQLGASDPKGPNDLESLLAPLTPLKTLSASRVVRWTINGVTAGVGHSDNYANAGQLTEDRSLAKAAYDAPTREPETNPVAIAAEVDLKQFGRIILVQSIQVESNSLLQVGGQTDSNPNISLTVTGKELRAVIMSGMGVPMVSFVIPNYTGKGTYSFPEPKGIVNQATAVVDYGNGYTQGYYHPVTTEWISGNVTLTISEHGGSGKPTRGTIGGTFFKGTSGIGVRVKFKAVPVYIP
ncbi:hypothetical protein BN8_02214 [Fibrisoma limi BUZ 3]|uniref:ZU5 domain-containing protein n=1 Tax=Fibrisoma limi BUZ 3 TaxID=1185876 RepID=I2GGW7_9BACT|nr:hypothetical protein [Fibrisoma limi]CCH53142.1 hypothetical protein BN8_02214 [Fibrisoma limi BUZ 3]